jgi:hypothetical protein
LDFILRGRALRGDGGGKTENIGKNAQSRHMMRNLKKRRSYGFRYGLYASNDMFLDVVA